MRLIRRDNVSYEIVDVSMAELATIQLCLISAGLDDIKIGKNWESSEPKFKPPLTVSRLMRLSDLDMGIERGYKLRYYPRGAEDADHPMVQVLRAFTYEGGGLYPHYADVRDAFVWTSGLMEHWFPVPELLCALDNMDGSYGLDQPMATIDKE